MFGRTWGTVLGMIRGITRMKWHHPRRQIQQKLGCEASSSNDNKPRQLTSWYDFCFPAGPKIGNCWNSFLPLLESFGLGSPFLAASAARMGALASPIRGSDGDDRGRSRDVATPALLRTCKATHIVGASRLKQTQHTRTSAMVYG